MNRALWMRWHRWLGIFVALPLLLWCVSGVLHPLMSRVKPAVAQHMPPPLKLHAEDIQVNLASWLQQKETGKVHRIRMVRFDDRVYFQVFKHVHDKALYIDSQNGTLLLNGDQRYAEYLARYYAGDDKSRIHSIHLVESFSIDYPMIHRLLPVWRVQFERDDDLTAFVDVESSRLGALADKKRFMFLKFFSWCHSWSFFEGYPELQIVLLSSICFLALLSGLSGLVIYSGLFQVFCAPKNRQQHISQWHRVGSALFSVGLLLFAFSGVWHALSKATPDMREKYFDDSSFALQNHKLPIKEAVSIAEKQGDIVSFDTFDFSSHLFFRITVHHKRHNQTIYLSADNLTISSVGDIDYSRYLAGKFSQLSGDLIASVTPLIKYNSEYGFIDKRLPVFRVNYLTGDHLRLYIEASTGHLAKRVDDYTSMERFSFSNLHKWGMIDFMGKNMRDSGMALFALANGIAAMLGLYLFFVRRHKKSKGRK